MFNLPGGPEMVVIILVALVVLGPQQLPKAMRTIGSVMAEIRKVSSGFQNEMKNAMDSITADETSSKPQSGHMGSANGASANGSTSPANGAGAEVMARNDASASGPPAVTQAVTSSETDHAEAEVVEHKIDPADRAAG